MTNRIVVVVVALVVGAGLYSGATAVEDALTPESGVAVSGEVVTANTTMHLDRVGRPTAVGEVINGLDGPVGDLRVIVTFRHEDGRRDEVVGRALVDPVPSGGRAPFSIRLADRAARPEGVEVEVAFERTAERGYDGLALASERVTERSESQVTVAGEVQNRGDRRVAAHVVATFYDGSGDVVGVRSVPTSPRVLEPGASGDFEVRLRTLGNVPSRADEVARYELSVRGEPVSGE